MLRALLVTYYFPPAGGGGVQRVLGWCRHLPAHGVEVTALAPTEPHWIDQDTTLVIPSSTEVLRTADPSPAAVIPSQSLAEVSGLRRLGRRIALQPRRIAVPDIHRRWRTPAVRVALEAARERDRNGTPPWDVVISSSPPETTHLIGHDVAQALGIPWVADLRDSWLDLPHLRLSSAAVRLKHRANTRLATKLMLHAAAATTVSAPLKEDLAGRHPGLDITVIENGIQLDQVARAQSRASGFRDPGRFVVAYTGNFFGLQSAASFLDAVEHACGCEPELAADLLVRFVGGLKKHEASQAALLNASVTTVEHASFVRHDDVLAQQRAADLLLLYVAPGVGSQGVYTGKVFEYVAARRPVLALAPIDNVAAKLLERAGLTTNSGGARVDPDDVSAISAALVAAWMTWREAGGRDGGITPDSPTEQSLIDSLDRADGARRLAELLSSVADSERRV